MGNASSLLLFISSGGNGNYKFYHLEVGVFACCLEIVQL